MDNGSPTFLFKCNFEHAYHKLVIILSKQPLMKNLD